MSRGLKLGAGWRYTVDCKQTRLRRSNGICMKKKIGDVIDDTL